MIKLQADKHLHFYSSTWISIRSLAGPEPRADSIVLVARHCHGSRRHSRSRRSRSHRASHCCRVRTAFRAVAHRMARQRQAATARRGREGRKGESRRGASPFFLSSRSSVHCHVCTMRSLSNEHPSLPPLFARQANDGEARPTPLLGEKGRVKTRLGNLGARVGEFLCL